MTFRKFVVQDSPSLSMVFKIGLLSGQIKPTDFNVHFFEAACIHDKTQDGFIWEKCKFSKLIYYFEDACPKAMNIKAFQENLDFLLALIEAKDEKVIIDEMDELYESFILDRALNNLKIKFKIGPVGFVDADNYNDVLKAFSRLDIVVAFLGDKINVFVKNKDTSFKLFGEKGISYLSSILCNFLGISWRFDELSCYSQNGSTEEDCKRAVQVIAAAI